MPDNGSQTTTAFRNPYRPELLGKVIGKCIVLVEALGQDVAWSLGINTNDTHARSPAVGRELGVTIAEQLAAIGGFDRQDLIWIERDLAYAMSSLGKRGNINWSLHFPWLKGRMCELQNHRCCWCSKLMAANAERDDHPTFEHIVPLVCGGKDEPSNMAIACYRCNNKRGSLPLAPGCRRPVMPWHRVDLDEAA